MADSSTTSAMPAMSALPIVVARSIWISTCRPLWRSRMARGSDGVAAIADELRRIGEARQFARDRRARSPRCCRS